MLSSAYKPVVVLLLSPLLKYWLQHRAGIITSCSCAAACITEALAAVLVVSAWYHKLLYMHSPALQNCMSLGSSSTTSATCVPVDCRPYEPGLHLDGSELTGLLQEDRQQRTTTDTGQPLLSGSWPS